MRRLLAISALLLASAAAQAAPPEWVRTAARAPVPELPPETDAVLLHDEELLTVSATGEMRALYRSAYRILRPDGRRYGEVLVHFDTETQLLSLRAWSITGKGVEYEVKEKDAIETSLWSGSVYEDTRQKFLRIPGAEPGSVVAYEYEQKLRPYSLQKSWFFQGPVPILYSRFALQLPSGWEYAAQFLNHPEFQPVSSSATYATWEVRNVPAIEYEPAMPPLASIAARMALRFYPRAGTAALAPAHREWNDIGVWYNTLTADRRGASPEIRAKVKELTSGATSSVEKLRALARFVQREVRYVSIQIGIGGYQPHPAPQVFSNRYGDCKDKATLLSTMLQEAGIESYYVIVYAGGRGYVQPQFPSINSFNHVILAVRLTGEVQQSFGPEIAHPRMGRLLFFDPTDDITPVGNLPGTLQASHGLLVTPTGGELVTLPLLPSTKNVLSRVARLTLSPSGTLAGDVEETYSGLFATSRRADLLRTPEGQRSKLVESYLGNFLNNVTLRSAGIRDLERYDEALALQYSFEAANYAKTAGNLLLVRPRVLGAKGEDVLEGKKPRKHPIEFDYPTLQTDIVEIRLPPGYVIDELPESVTLDNGIAHYSSRTELKDNVLRYERKFEVSGVFVRQEMFDKMKQFYRQIAIDERSSAVFRKAP